MLLCCVYGGLKGSTLTRLNYYLWALKCWMMEKHWDEFGRKREDTEAEMGDMSGHESVMCKEISWEEVVEVTKCLKRGKAAGPDGIMS